MDWSSRYQKSYTYLGLSLPQWISWTKIYKENIEMLIWITLSSHHRLLIEQEQITLPKILRTQGWAGRIRTLLMVKMLEHQICTTTFSSISENGKSSQLTWQPIGNHPFWWMLVLMDIRSLVRKLEEHQPWVSSFYNNQVINSYNMVSRQEYQARQEFREEEL